MNASPPGLRLLNRRAFLLRTVDGLGGIALCALLADETRAAASKAHRPEIDPARPYYPDSGIEHSLLRRF